MGQIWLDKQEFSFIVLIITNIVDQAGFVFSQVIFLRVPRLFGLRKTG